MHHWVKCSIVLMTLLPDMTKVSGEQCKLFSNPVFSSIIQNNVMYSVRLDKVTNKSYDNVVVQYQGNQLSNGNCTYKYCVNWTMDDGKSALVYLNLNISNSKTSESVQLDINVVLNCSAGNNTINVCIDMRDEVNVWSTEIPLRRIHIGTSLVCLFITILTIVAICYHIYNERDSANVRGNREDELYSQIELVFGTYDKAISVNTNHQGSLEDEETIHHILTDELLIVADVHIADPGNGTISTYDSYEPLDSQRIMDHSYL